MSKLFWPCWPRMSVLVNNLNTTTFKTGDNLGKKNRHTACSSLSEVSKQYQWTSEVRTPSVYQTRHYHPRLELNHPEVKRDVQMRLMLSWIYPGILCQLKINRGKEMCTAKWVWLVCFKCFFTTSLHSMCNSYVSSSSPMCIYSLKPHQPLFLLPFLNLK